MPGNQSGTLAAAPQPGARGEGTQAILEDRRVPSHFTAKALREIPNERL
jgi:hypothetical protein